MSVSGKNGDFIEGSYCGHDVLMCDAASEKCVMSVRTDVVSLGTNDKSISSAVRKQRSNANKEQESTLTEHPLDHP